MALHLLPFQPSFSHFALEAILAQMDYQVCMACRDLLAHPAVMDEMELKETRATQGRLGPRDHLVQME